MTDGHRMNGSRVTDGTTGSEPWPGKPRARPSGGVWQDSVVYVDVTGHVSGPPSAAPAFHLALSGPTHDICAQHDNRLTRRMLSRCRGATAPGRAENVRRSSARVGAKPQHRAWPAILRGSRRGRAPRACEPASGRSRRGDPRLLTLRLPQGVCPWPTWSDTPPTVVRVQQSQVAAT